MNTEEDLLEQQYTADNQIKNTEFKGDRNSDTNPPSPRKETVVSV
jgi:hypothetical protein